MRCLWRYSAKRAASRARTESPVQRSAAVAKSEAVAIARSCGRPMVGVANVIVAPFSCRRRSHGGRPQTKEQLRSLFAESGSCFAPLHGGNIHIARPLENQLEVLPRRSDRTARRAPKCLKAQRKVRDKTRTAGRSSNPVLKYWRQRGAHLGWATRGRFSSTAQSRRPRSAAAAARSAPSPSRSSD